jgi:hypothetical protein
MSVEKRVAAYLELVTRASPRSLSLGVGDAMNVAHELADGT